MYNSSLNSFAQSPSNMQAAQAGLQQEGYQPRIMDRKDFTEGRVLSKQYFNRMNRESNMDLFIPSEAQQEAFLKKNMEYATFVKAAQVDKNTKLFQMSHSSKNLSMDEKYRRQREIEKFSRLPEVERKSQKRHSIKGLMQFAGHYGSPGSPGPHFLAKNTDSLDMLRVELDHSPTQSKPVITEPVTRPQPLRAEDPVRPADPDPDLQHAQVLRRRI